MPENMEKSNIENITTPQGEENEILTLPENFVQISPHLKNGERQGKEKPIIEIRNITMKFPNSKTEALKNITFDVEKGDAFGFIGPNGAGKTTTIRILGTLLEPTEGEAFIGGYSIFEEPENIREIIGYMPDYFGVYEGLKVSEYLEFFAAAYKNKKNTVKTLVKDVIEITDLGNLKDKFVESLSKGMRQRLGIAKTLIHDPKVLILDEPAAGLDPRARIELKELLKELTRMGKTIFISSHILPELADICNKIGIIEAGKILAFGAVSDFVNNNVQQKKLKQLIIKALNDSQSIIDSLLTHPCVKEAKQDNGHICVFFDGDGEKQNELLKYLIIEKNLKITEFSEKSANLEDIFMNITKGELA